MSSYVIFVQQGTFLCGQYIRNRLKRSGIYHRKLGLKRITNVKLLGESLVNEVQQDLLAIGAELEKLQPKFYEKIGRQIGYGTFNSEQRIIEAINDVAREMFRNNECNWPKIVSLYAVAGGMAVDCVRQGKSEFLPAIQKGMGLVLEEDLAAWIQANGGWVGENKIFFLRFFIIHNNKLIIIYFFFHRAPYR